MTSKTCATLVLILLAGPAAAQTTAQNLTKYWSLRARLLTDFMVKGSGPGESVPAQERSDIQGHIKFADSTIVHGWYLGVLATEYAILTAPAAYPGAAQGNTMRTQQTLDELYLSLHALERLDEVADQAFPAPCTQMPVLNGFFIRDDVPGNMHTRVAGTLTSTQSDFIDPVLTNKEMSQDQVYHLLIGLALVKQLIPASVTVQGKGLRAWSMELAGRIGMHTAASGWTIKNPACANRSVNRGEGAVGYSGGTKLAISFCTDGAVAPTTSGIWDTAWSLLKSPSAPVYSNVNNLHMAMAIAAVGNGWGSTTANDLAVLSRSEDWVAYPLLHRTLYGMNATGYCAIANEVSGKARTMLDELPVGAEPANPLPGGPAVHQFTTNHRFYRPKAQAYVGAAGNDGLRFSGLDFMLLHNLYALADPSTWAGSACGSPCAGAGMCMGGAGGGGGGTGGGSGSGGGGASGGGQGGGASGGGSATGGGSGTGGGAGGTGGGGGSTGGGAGSTGGGAGGSAGGTGGGAGSTGGGTAAGGGGGLDAGGGCGCASSDGTWLLTAAALWLCRGLRRRRVRSF